MKIIKFAEITKVTKIAKFAEITNCTKNHTRENHKKSQNFRKSQTSQKSLCFLDCQITFKKSK